MTGITAVLPPHTFDAFLRDQWHHDERGNRISPPPSQQGIQQQSPEQDRGNQARLHGFAIDLFADQPIEDERALRVRDEDEAAEVCLATIAAGVIVREEDRITLNREGFNTLPHAYRRRMLRKAVDLAGADSRGLSSVQVGDAIAFMIAAQTGRTMHMPYGLIIEREYEKFVIRYEAPADGFSYKLEISGTTLIPALGIDVEAGVFSTVLLSVGL